GARHSGTGVVWSRVQEALLNHKIQLPAAFFPVFIVTALLTAALLAEWRELLMLLPPVTRMLVFRSEMLTAIAPFTALVSSVGSMVIVRKTVLVTADIFMLLSLVLLLSVLMSLPFFPQTHFFFV